MAIPNPYTGQFENLGQLREPWQLNFGAQIAYEITPANRSDCGDGQHLQHLLRRIGRAMDGGIPSKPRRLRLLPEHVVLRRDAGAAYFYGNSPHAAGQRHGRLSESLRSSVHAGPVQIAAPFQAYFQINIKV